MLDGSLSAATFECSRAVSLSQTSIMAVAFKGGVIVGADSRTSTGWLQSPTPFFVLIGALRPSVRVILCRILIAFGRRGVHCKSCVRQGDSRGRENLRVSLWVSS